MFLNFYFYIFLDSEVVIEKFTLNFSSRSSAILLFSFLLCSLLGSEPLTLNLSVAFAQPYPHPSDEVDAR